jgi:hypothetical protein
MRRSRERRRRGLRFLTIELRESEVEGLIRYGWIARADRDDPVALRKGLYAFLHDWLGKGPALFPRKGGNDEPSAGAGRGVNEATGRRRSYSR